MDLTNPSLAFIDIAHGMGVAGRRVAYPNEIEPAVKEALALGTPYLLEVITEGRVPAQ